MTCLPGRGCAPPMREVIPEDLKRETENQWAASAALITAIALVVIGACLAGGCMTPGIDYHIAAYLAAGCMILSIVPFAIAAVLLCRQAPAQIES